MKKISPRLSLFVVSLLSPWWLAAAETVIPADFDSTIDFWSGLIGEDWSENGQAYASNSGKWDSATEAVFHREYDYMGMLIRFDVSEVTPALVNDPEFSAVLDVMFHGFASDENRYAEYNPDPGPDPGAGDRKIYLDVYRVLEDYHTSANRWMKNSVELATLENWDGSAPTSAEEARALGTNFGQSGELPIAQEAEDQVVLVKGWSAEDPLPGSTPPNQYGWLTWDVTELVREWVNGEQPNYGVFIHVNKEKSWGEQVNLLTMETSDRPEDGIAEAGDATPLLRLSTEKSVSLLPLAVGPVETGGNLSLQFASEAGRTYWLERSHDLESWDVVVEQSIVGDGTEQVIPASGPAQGNVFYRITAPGN